MSQESTPTQEEIRAAGLDARTSFNRLWARIARLENLVPRTHATIGGMWTVDRFRLGTLEALLMDEGWTQVIRAPGLDAWVDGNHPDPVFRQGDAALLAWLSPRWY